VERWFGRFRERFEGENGKEKEKGKRVSLGGKEKGNGGLVKLF